MGGFCALMDPAPALRQWVRRMRLYGLWAALTWAIATHPRNSFVV